MSKLDDTLVGLYSVPAELRPPEAKSAIKALMLEIIGEDEPAYVSDTYRGLDVNRPNYDGMDRNMVRAELRKKVEAL